MYDTVLLWSFASSRAKARFKRKPMVSVHFNLPRIQSNPDAEAATAHLSVILPHGRQHIRLDHVTVMHGDKAMSPFFATVS